MDDEDMIDSSFNHFKHLCFEFYACSTFFKCLHSKLIALYLIKKMLHYLKRLTM